MGKIMSVGKLQKGGYTHEDVSACSEVDDAVEADLLVDRSPPTGTETDTLCRGRNACSSFTPRPYLMMWCSPGAAVGAGRAETRCKSASAAAEGMETFIGYGVWKNKVKKIIRATSCGVGYGLLRDRQQQQRCALGSVVWE